MIDREEHIKNLLSGSERTSEIWYEFQPKKINASDPLYAEKLNILKITLGYMSLILELYEDVKSALDDDRYFSGIILTRSLVEGSAMLCFFHEQIKAHFYPSPSAKFYNVIEKHINGFRHKVSDDDLDLIQPHHIMNAIRSSNEFASGKLDRIKAHLGVASNVEELVPGAKRINYDIVEELGEFGWIYSILSEFSHPNPINNRRYFANETEKDEFVSDDTLKCLIAEGLGKTMFYAYLAADPLLILCDAKSPSP